MDKVFALRITLENDAFEQCGCLEEVARILRELSDRMMGQFWMGGGTSCEPGDLWNLRDINVNHVGAALVQLAQPEGE